MIALLAAAAVAVAAAPPAARLDVDIGSASYAVAVERGGATTSGALHIDCIAACRSAVHFTEAVDDVPLGLFRLWDGDNLVFTTWGGGSVYRVRAYAINARGVRKVLEAASRGAPAFTTATDGTTVVGTTERGDRDPPSAPLHRVSWTWRHDHFVRRATP
ncbi:hypothetical protein KZX46_14950 [Polymorphobacter sp. PAMC 29334]|uniref:hypothetical protein n=1 Tax=Polymorphobacter sp. PAMC 29334 TaxID=2862331 RepID=UPI001C771C3D|nr:hypothetical protein [Polymorphobacter sp. PAMC 29334]QYE34084.1 hypothetical protein KZX46_14950 [Polymorphobacter sp. PAMC 29334]